MRRTLVALVAVLSLAPVGGAAPADARGSAHPPAWTAREGVHVYLQGSCSASASVAMGPDGVVFVTSEVKVGAGRSDIMLTARRAAGGAPVWEARFDAMKNDHPADLIVGPDGTVFVIGTIGQAEDAGHAVVVAFAGADGTLLWHRTITGPIGFAEGADLTMAPDGSALFLAANIGQPASAEYKHPTNVLVAALDPADGSQIWATTYTGPDTSVEGCGTEGGARALAATPTSVILTLTERGSATRKPWMTTLALDATSGTSRWSRSLPGRGGGQEVVPTAGGTITVAEGVTRGRSPTAEPAPTIVAYATATGERLWLRRFSRPGPYPTAEGLTAAPAGDHVFAVLVGGDTHLVVSIDGGTGALTWTSPWTPSESVAKAAGGVAGMGVTPDGSHVFIATTLTTRWACGGWVQVGDYGLLRFSAITGAGGLWGTYSAPYRDGWDLSTSLTMGRGGKLVYVTGLSSARYRCDGAARGYDVATAAFRTR